MADGGCVGLWIVGELIDYEGGREREARLVLCNKITSLEKNFFFAACSAICGTVCPVARSNEHSCLRSLSRGTDAEAGYVYARPSKKHMRTLILRCVVTINAEKTRNRFNQSPGTNKKST